MTVGEQDHLLRHRWPGFSVEWDCECASWRGHLRPTPVSCEYLVRIDYRLGQRPSVTVITPKLEKRDGMRAPHLYPNGSLCLFKPKNKEWEPSMPIADVIVPWIALWLFHYENWLATGVWAGGGEHPDKGRGSTRRRATFSLRTDREDGTAS